MAPSNDKHQRSRAAVVESGVRFVHRAPRRELSPHGENDFAHDDSLGRSADVMSTEDHGRGVYGVVPPGPADKFKYACAFDVEGILR